MVLEDQPVEGFQDGEGGGAVEEGEQLDYCLWGLVQVVEALALEGDLQLADQLQVVEQNLL